MSVETFCPRVCEKLCAPCGVVQRTFTLFLLELWDICCQYKEEKGGGGEKRERGRNMWEKLSLVSWLAVVCSCELRVPLPF